MTVHRITYPSWTAKPQPLLFIALVSVINNDHLNIINNIINNNIFNINSDYNSSSNSNNT